MFIIAQILSDDDNILRLVGEQIFPSEESAQNYINKVLQKQANVEAERMLVQIKQSEEAMEKFNTYDSRELVIKNFLIMPVSNIVTIQNDELHL